MNGLLLSCTIAVVVCVYIYKKITWNFELYMDVQNSLDHKGVQITADLPFNVPINAHNYVTSYPVHMIFTVEIWKKKLLWKKS